MGMRAFGATLCAAADVTKCGGAILVASAITASALLFAAPARAQDCPGNPDAIGTSRVLTLEPGELTRVGKLQYPDTLPLNDHEVVLTFDDGPLPPYSNQILDILAAQCVKATFFMIGRMAHEFPEIVRRVHDAGHTIGTHSENHPLHFGKLPIERMRAEIDDGIANVGAALGDPSELAPFFRIPGLEDSPTLDSELAARSLVVFSVDAVADDWHHRIKPAQIVSRAIERLEARGRGILLLHDIHPATVAALPGLLQELKVHGFRIVQVKPATPWQPMVAQAGELTVAWTEVAQNFLDDSSAVAVWPPAMAGAAPDVVVLPAPDAKSFAVDDVLAPHADAGDIEAGGHLADAGSASTPWTAEPATEEALSEPQLPVPSLADIGLSVESRLVAAPIDTANGADTGNADAESNASVDAGPTAVKAATPDVTPTARNTVSHDVKKAAPKLARRHHERLHAHRHAHLPERGRQHADLFSTLATLD
jgi:peptidoglycan/xylan/chitin deacetylase (PgdA/CDA1 family)